MGQPAVAIIGPNTTPPTSPFSVLIPAVLQELATMDPLGVHKPHATLAVVISYGNSLEKLGCPVATLPV
jgi:hypothetical protein